MAVQAAYAARVPAHVALIMDGNRRWAARHSVSLAQAYGQGVAALLGVVRCALDLRIGALTVFGFSTENWTRDLGEIALLMQLCEQFARDYREPLIRDGVRVTITGDVAKFSFAARSALRAIVRASRDNNRLTLNLALNYSGRTEIVRAVQTIAQQVARGALQAAAVDESRFRSFLYAPELPDPDLLIRTGGDLRLSNFLLYQLAYTELTSLPVLWPDFGPSDFRAAVADFARRERRFGS